MPRLHAAFTKLLTGARAHFAFAEEISDFASGRFDGIRTVGTIFGQAVSVISTQSTGQCICRIGRAQQIAVTLNSIFTFQHGNNDRARSHEFNQTIKERFSIIKPNAVAKNVIGSIFARFETAGFKIVGTKMLHLTVEQARGFYAEHDGKPFFDGLVEFMTSGPIVVSVLEGENAVQRHRDLLGATNPANALAGTLRADYADSLTENGTHGSDSVESAAREIAYFFGEGEVCPRTR